MIGVRDVERDTTDMLRGVDCYLGRAPCRIRCGFEFAGILWLEVNKQDGERRRVISTVGVGVECLVLWCASLVSWTFDTIDSDFNIHPK